MLTEQELKLKLLQTGVFIDNEYLDNYIDLVYNYSTLEKYTEKHHILQRYYYKRIGCPVDNSIDNIVRLSYKDHCKAHWLLYFCTDGYLRHANEKSVKYISQMYKKLTGIEKHKFNFIQEDFELLQNYMNSIIEDKNSKYWSTTEINYLIEHYKGYGSGPACAKALNRPLSQVNAKARKLGLTSNCPDWTADELQILYKYYPIEGTRVYSRIPMHSEAACRAMAVKLDIRVETHYWSNEDIQKFKDNASKPLTEIQKLFPNRTYASIKHYWQRHIKEQIKNGKDNDRRKN